MWPLERRADVVRVGRNRIEYWTSSAQGLVRLGEQTLDCAKGMRETELAGGLGRLLRTVQDKAGASGTRPARIDMVFESAWLPIMLIDIGDTLWSRKALEALLRHRFAQHYNDRDDPVAAWELRLDYRPGDAWGLGYGLAPTIRQAAIDAAEAEGRRLGTLQPAFAWGWAGLKQHPRKDGRAVRHGDWWLWIEQDRSLVCYVDERGRLRSMNAGAAVPEDASQCLRLIEIEALRQGIPAEGVRGVVLNWRPTPHAARGADDRLALVSIAAGEATAQGGSTALVQAGVGA